MNAASNLRDDDAARRRCAARNINNPAVIRFRIRAMLCDRDALGLEPYVPEPAIFAALCNEPAQYRHDPDVVDEVINTMLDNGELRAFSLDCRETGHGLVPALRAI